MIVSTILFLVAWGLVSFFIIKLVTHTTVYAFPWHKYIVNGKKVKVRHASYGWSYACIQVRSRFNPFKFQKEYEYPKEHQTWDVTKFSYVEELSDDERKRILDNLVVDLNGGNNE